MSVILPQIPVSSYYSLVGMEVVWLWRWLKLWWCDWLFVLLWISSTSCVSFNKRIFESRGLINLFNSIISILYIIVSNIWPLKVCNQKILQLNLGTNLKKKKKKPNSWYLNFFFQDTGKWNKAIKQAEAASRSMNPACDYLKLWNENFSI